MPNARLLFVILLLSSVISYGQRGQGSYEVNNTEQEIEVSLWSQDGGNLSPWVFYRGDKITAETRYNWDDKGVYGTCIGKQFTFGKKSLTLIPEACGYTGRYNGYGPELWVISEKEKFFFSSYIQYASMKRTTSYGYLWLQSDYKFSKNFGLGPGLQSLKDGSRANATDVGLSLVFRKGKFYANFIPLWRVTKDGRGSFTNYGGIGYVFERK